MTDAVSARLDRVERELARVKLLYEKTLRYREADPEIALAQARKSAEAICKQIYRSEGLEAGGKPAAKMMLDELLSALARRRCLPRHIIHPLRTIQAFGNFGAHDQGEDACYITTEYIQPCLAALATVVSWYFQDYHDGVVEMGAGAHGASRPAPRTAPPAPPPAPEAPVFHYHGPRGQLRGKLEEVAAWIAASPQEKHLVWREGFADWKNWKDVGEIRTSVEGSYPPPSRKPPPPEIEVPAGKRDLQRSVCHGCGYEGPGFRPITAPKGKKLICPSCGRSHYPQVARRPTKDRPASRGGGSSMGCPRCGYSGSKFRAIQGTKGRKLICPSCGRSHYP
jgi:hypothetical protein